MALDISSELVARLCAEAAASPAVEICGLLFGSAARIDTARSCRNVAAEPTSHFELDPAALFAAHRAARHGGGTIVGHYHSHPSGSTLPSRRDADAAAPDGAVWLIVADGKIGAWRAVADGHLHGRFDPVILDIELSSPAR